MATTTTTTTTTTPAPNTLGDHNAYFCCGCHYGPMLFALHPACIECGKPACAYCGPATIVAHPHQYQPAAQQAADPRDPYGAVLGFGTATDDRAMMQRYLDEEPGVAERLLAGAQRGGLAEKEEELDAMMRQYGYGARSGGEKL